MVSTSKKNLRRRRQNKSASSADGDGRDHISVEDNNGQKKSDNTTISAREQDEVGGDQTALRPHHDADQDDDDGKDDIVFDSSVRNIGLWRICFFCIMMTEWALDSVLTPFGALNDLELNVKQGEPGKDRWFAYNQFEWVQDIHHDLSGDAEQALLLHRFGFVLCFLAAFAPELRLHGCWRICASLFTILYLIRFLAKSPNFTNHNYLFPLLMVLTIVSGGGHVNGRLRSRKERGGAGGSGDASCCQAAVIAMRAQLAILYFFASIWKLHADWFAGRICRNIFISFQDSNKARGIPWRDIEQVFPDVFRLLAWSGFLLDASMASVLIFSRPSSTSSVYWLLAFTLMFHSSTTFMMAQMIGYSFPGTCIVALWLFLPLSIRTRTGVVVCDDCNLLQWLGRYTRALLQSGRQCGLQDDSDGEEKRWRLPRRSQMLFVLVWVGWQIAMPMRLLIVSNGEFAYNRLGYRYSWTMMLHALDYGIVRHREEDKSPQSSSDTVLLLQYFVPTCFTTSSEDMFMPRSIYLGEMSENLMQDSRTVPMHQILSARESYTMDAFPSHLASRIGAGLARLIDSTVGSDACTMIKFRDDTVGSTKKRMGMHAVFFGRLNENGPYSRLFDPTVDLVSTVEAQEAQSHWETLRKSLLDERPDDHEFVLRKGVGSMRKSSSRFERGFSQKYPGKEVRFIADRAACLGPRPIWLRPMGFSYALTPSKLPNQEVRLVLKWVDERVGKQVHTEELRQGEMKTVTATALEIGLSDYDESISCRETEKEDVLISILF